jgi:hypothetical protein
MTRVTADSSSVYAPVTLKLILETEVTIIPVERYVAPEKVLMILLEGGFRNREPDVATTRDVKSEVKPEIRSVSNVEEI